jgi:hypothetical protein
MKEIEVVRRFRKGCVTQYGKDIYIKKIHQDQYSEPGVPDLVGTFKMRGFVIEAKVLTTTAGAIKRFTKDQLDNLFAAQQAGALSLRLIYYKGDYYLERWDQPAFCIVPHTLPEVIASFYKRFARTAE